VLREALEGLLLRGAAHVIFFPVIALAAPLRPLDSMRWSGALRAPMRPPVRRALLPRGLLTTSRVLGMVVVSHGDS